MGQDTVGILNDLLAGRYRIVGEVGAGGMAVVYRAEDLKHRRPVAIKVFHIEGSESTEQERFAREIEIAASLNHPNILGLHDSGATEGYRYFVMPYVEGDSLRDVLDREGRLDVDRAVMCAREIADGLAYAHERGLVHRDIKPGNVLLQAGHAVLCDFGIAKVATGASGDGLTRTGTSVGTIDYMSPEQLSDGAVVDARSDIFSLGCVLYEMLEGERPFSASTSAAALAKKLQGDVPEAPSSGDVPQPVWDVVRTALAMDPADRYTNAGDLASALAFATTEAARVQRGRRRRRRAIARVAAALVMVPVAVVGASWLSARLEGPRYERIAVMPLASGVPDDVAAFYAQGVHEDLVQEMQRAGLRVVNASSTRRLASSGESLPQIAEALGVDAVIEGAVERVGPRVVLDMRLVDAATEELVWSGSFAGDRWDIFAVLRDATRGIARETGAEASLGGDALLADAGRVDAVLYELLLQARYERAQLTSEGFDEAERHYRRAIARDSMSVSAWMGLASMWNVRAQEGLVPGDEARAIRDSILATAPVSGLADRLDLHTRALQLTWVEWPEARWSDAEDAFLGALEARPGDAVTRAYYALLLLYLGREDDAEREGARAASQAPDDPLVQGLYGQLLNARYRWDEAERVLTRARRFDPDAPILLSTLRTTYHLQGEDSLAIESWRDSYRQRDDLEALGALNEGVRAGGYARALRSVAELFEARRARGEGVSEWQIGTLYTRGGVPGLAIDYLTLAVDEGDPNAPYLSVDPIFDPLRSDPRFQALVDRLRLPR